MNKLYIIALGLLVLASCTTQKKRSDQSALSKAWHNTNAHYNGYFNADETITESILLLNEQHEDNYLQLLDIYPYTEVDNPQAVAEQLDEAVKKVTVVVNLHPYSQWSDDCYFIAGQALYLKQDYEGAEKAFRYLVNEYPPENKEAVKKERNKSSKSSRGSSSKSSRTRNDDSSSDASANRPKTQREKERERKQYNKEVARKKRERAKAKKQGRSTPRTPKETSTTTEAPKTDTPSPTPTETTSTDGETGRTGPVRLSNNAEAAIDNSGENYRMKHRPAFQEGQLWLARTLIERDNYNAARRILSQLEQNENTFKDIRKETAVAQAHLAIKEKNYLAATTALNIAISKATDKEDRARLAFILGQLQQQLGNSSAAYAAYEQVVKARPIYEMEFGARLNMAQNAYKAGGGNAVDAIRNLEKLLKDDKNIPYYDQIYFTMAQIELEQGNEEEGMAYMQKSLANSSSNRAQKAEAYYYLATLFYGKNQYLPAKLYYDSTLTLMTQSDSRHGDTERLRNSLVDIATNIETITLQDSLLALVNLTEDERAELAKKIQTQRNEEAKVGKPTSDKFGGFTAPSSSRASSALQTATDFWAYNEQSKKRGAREFNRRWGGRSLEDNWRRSSSLGESALDVEEVAEVDVNLLTKEEIDKILEDVPTDAASSRAAELSIKKAMFNLGRLYRDRLENNEKCVEVLEELNERFPGNLHELDSWYYLYVAYTSLNNSTKAKEYRDKIIQKYPSSNYGQILINPNYAQEQLNEELKMNQTYDAVYALFEQGQYQSVLTQAETNANSIIGDHPLKPRYALLMAMATGSTKGKEAYILELQKLIATYKGKDVPEETRAKEILRLLGGGGASLPGGTQEDNGNFTLNDSELHYFLVVFDSDDIDLNANKIAVSDYNKQYHSLDRIRISNIYLGDKNNVPVLVLRRFKDKAKVMDYYNGLVKNGDDFIDPSANSFTVLPISQSNYREVLRNRSVEGYEAFFKGNY